MKKKKKKDLGKLSTSPTTYKVRQPVILTVSKISLQCYRWFLRILQSRALSNSGPGKQIAQIINSSEEVDFSTSHQNVVSDVLDKKQNMNVVSENMYSVPQNTWTIFREVLFHLCVRTIVHTSATEHLNNHHNLLWHFSGETKFWNNELAVHANGGFSPTEVTPPPPKKKKKTPIKINLWTILF